MGISAQFVSNPVKCWKLVMFCISENEKLGLQETTWKRAIVFLHNIVIDILYAWLRLFWLFFDYLSSAYFCCQN